MSKGEKEEVREPLEDNIISMFNSTYLIFHYITPCIWENLLIFPIMGAYVMSRRVELILND